MTSTTALVESRRTPPRFFIHPAAVSGADSLSPTAVSVAERGPELVVGTPRHVLTDPYRREEPGVANYDISPTDGRIVFVEDSDAASAPADRLYVALNWFTELLSHGGP